MRRFLSSRRVSSRDSLLLLVGPRPSHHRWSRFTIPSAKLHLRGNGDGTRENTVEPEIEQGTLWENSRVPETVFHRIRRDGGRSPNSKGFPGSLEGRRFPLDRHEDMTEGLPRRKAGISTFSNVDVWSPCSRRYLHCSGRFLLDRCNGGVLFSASRQRSLS